MALAPPLAAAKYVSEPYRSCYPGDYEQFVNREELRLDFDTIQRAGWRSLDIQYQGGPVLSEASFLLPAAGSR